MRTVVVVDDNKEHADIAARAAKMIPGTEVRVFTQPFLALRDIKDCPPDLIVTDLMMPVLDGITLIREARKAGVLSRAIIVSAYHSEVSDRLLPGNNVSHVISKPYSLVGLVEAIRSSFTHIEEGRAAHGEAPSAQPSVSSRHPTPL
jgi:DNA-binding response OmpR family regulator